MKNCILILILLTATGILRAQKARKAIFVIADGIPADVIESQKTPALKEIAKEGGYARAYVGGEKDGYSQSPTISAVGYNSLLTGTWANKHNVWDNDITAPNYNYWNVFRLLETQYPKKKTAVFSTWLDNRTKLVGSEAKAAGNLQPDYFLDGLELDTIRFPHDTAGYFYYLIDETVTDKAAETIRKSAPDLTWIYLEYTDEMGHRHGDGDKMNDAVEKMDKQIGRIREAMKYREKNFKEDWVIFITTDHGRDSLKGHDHGGQSDRERTTWIVTDAADLNERFTKQRPGIVDILPTLTRFLQLTMTRERLREVDGVSLTGKLSATDAKAVYRKDKIRVTWKPILQKGLARVYLSTTDSFAIGGHDKYRLVQQVPVANGATEFDVSKYPSEVYKISIEMPYNLLNTRIVIGKKN
ncbi:MAG: alkaline phosphatase family protein [Chitinophagaceae bacterium]|nr:alkaline phosphatase family protein [Chitinophagaceae bacterium]